MSDWTRLKINSRHKVAIAGQVSDAVTGQIIGNAIVEITKMPKAFETKRSLQELQYGCEWERLVKRCDRTTTASDGFFYFLDLPKGEYTLTASLPGAATRYKIIDPATVTVPPSGTSPSQPKFAVANLTLSPSGIRGTVTDLKGVAIARVNVKILGSGESTVTDNDGTFKLIGLEAPKQEDSNRKVQVEDSKRNVKVNFSATGYQEKTESFEFSLGEVVEKKNSIQLTKQNGKNVKQNNTS